MSGKFTSDPYKGEDWSGRGRETYYLDLEPDVMIHPKYRPILSTERLMLSLPGFDWRGGHSGRLLESEMAERLEELWAEFLEKNEEMFIPRTYKRSKYITIVD